MVSKANVNRWEGEPPSRGLLKAIMREAGLSPRRWANRPGYRYAAHSHPYHKVLYCAQGSIQFRMEPDCEAYELGPG